MASPSEDVIEPEALKGKLCPALAAYLLQIRSKDIAVIREVRVRLRSPPFHSGPLTKRSYRASEDFVRTSAKLFRSLSVGKKGLRVTDQYQAGVPECGCDIGGIHSESRMIACNVPGVAVAVQTRRIDITSFGVFSHKHRLCHGCRPELASAAHDRFRQPRITSGKCLIEVSECRIIRIDEGAVRIEVAIHKGLCQSGRSLIVDGSGSKERGQAMLDTLAHIILLPEKGFRDSRIVLSVEQMCKGITSVTCSERIVGHRVQTFGNRHERKQSVSIFQDFSEEQFRLRTVSGECVCAMIFLPRTFVKGHIHSQSKRRFPVYPEARKDIPAMQEARRLLKVCQNEQCDFLPVGRRLLQSGYRRIRIPESIHDGNVTELLQKVEMPPCPEEIHLSAK